MFDVCTLGNHPKLIGKATKRMIVMKEDIDTLKDDWLTDNVETHSLA